MMGAPSKRLDFAGDWPEADWLVGDESKARISSIWLIVEAITFSEAPGESGDLIGLMNQCPAGGREPSSRILPKGMA
jgi:hypothetical protein